MACSFFRAGLVVVCLLAAGVTANARQPVQQAENVTAAAIERGRAALTAGRAIEALGVADEILAREPANRDAMDVKIRALVSQRKVASALDAYDAFAAKSGKHDQALLQPVAAFDLQDVARSAGIDETLRVNALERLARSGHEPSRAELVRASRDFMLTARGLDVDVSLARLGDAAAANRLAQMASSDAIREKAIVAEAIKAAGAKNQAYALIPLLRHSSPETRMAAADALGALGVREALAGLRELLNDPVPAVRNRAAVALRRLGDPSADDRLAALLKSDVPDGRLLAVEAYAGGKGREWVATVRPYLSDADPLVRLRAAELLARAHEEPAAYLDVLAKASTHPDFGVRREAARILESVTPTDVATISRLLRDSDPWVRMYAAGALLPRPAAAR